MILYNVCLFMLFSTTKGLGANEVTLGLAFIALLSSFLQYIFGTIKDAKRVAADLEMADKNNARDIELAKIKADTADIHKDLEKAETIIADLEKRVAETVLSHKELSEENTALRERVVKLESVIENMRAEIAEKEAQIRKLSNSG